MVVNRKRGHLVKPRKQLNSPKNVSRISENQQDNLDIAMYASSVMTIAANVHVVSFLQSMEKLNIGKLKGPIKKSTQQDQELYTRIFDCFPSDNTFERNMLLCRALRLVNELRID